MTRPLPRILATIRERKADEIAALLADEDLAGRQAQATARIAADPPRPFEAAVRRPGPLPRVIAEIKKASPSKGVIREDFDPSALAAAYARGGAAALSCLTDEHFFQGSFGYLQPVRETSGLPVLCKDFLIDPVQICEACTQGADAVLLIARMLEADRLAELYALATRLSLGVLVEVHDEADLDKALTLAPTLIGINNRDLDTFTVDVETTFRLRERIPGETPVVCESGIETHAQLERLAAADIAAVLVGESLMRAPDVAAALKRLRGEPSAERGGGERPTPPTKGQPC
jgi:indole-3-glycerol phosphate synthase